jgi:large subunit ribosomal protein L7/L12
MAETSKLDALRKRQEEIRAKIAEEESKRRKREEKEDTRLKLLVGSAVLADIEKTPETKAALLAVVERGITAPKDREFLKSKGWL